MKDIPAPYRHRRLALAWRGPALICLLLGVLTAVLVAGCTSQPALSVYLESHKDDLARPASASGAPIEFTVKPGTTSREIAQQLQDAGLITDARLFEAYVRLNGLAGRLQAGTFSLSAAMTPVQIADTLQHAQAASITITIPEGWRLEQTADYLNASGLLDGAEYRRLALGGVISPSLAISFDFLAARPDGSSLEGYLFPDTYELPRQGAGAADLLKRQLANFAGQVMPIYQDALSQGRTSRTLNEIITLASIVERETAVDEERPTIAGVYFNRLHNGMLLQADPTVQYAMGLQEVTGQWWKTPVSLEEYDRVISPYNTYLNPGLPPGPIASPGLASIKAALDPARHDYLYFVALPDGSGRHAFARTFEEHQQNVRRYRGQ